MQTYEILSYIEITGGVVALTEEQAKARIHNLKPAGEHYEVLGPIGFKKGEIVGIEGFEPPKGQAQNLTPVDDGVIGEPGTETDEDEDDDAVEVNTVGDLAKVLGKNIAETVTFLAGNYSFAAKNGKTDIPQDVFEALVADGVIGEPGTETDEDGNPAE